MLPTGGGRLGGGGGGGRISAPKTAMCAPVRVSKAAGDTISMRVACFRISLTSYANAIHTTMLQNLPDMLC
uniref:Uncharacterized protein n=1 Tax=Anguilla anguilla TaxID=7936 RepID=A0A0E9R0Q3_ANGAN